MKSLLLKLWVSLLIFWPALAGEPKSRLLVSVHLVPQENKISWTYAIGEWRGTGKDRQFWPDKLEEYSIDIDAASMSVGDDSRDVSRSAAHHLRDLRDSLVAMANDFTVEWNEGTPIEPKTKPARVGPVANDGWDQWPGSKTLEIPEQGQNDTVAPYKPDRALIEVIQMGRAEPVLNDDSAGIHLWRTSPTN